MTDAPVLPADSKPRHHSAAVLAVLAAAALFALLRIALIFARDPDIDELFTTWIVSKDLGAMLQALVRDSGPPLFYFAARALHLWTVTAVRFFSFACAAATFVFLMVRLKSWSDRWAVAALFAVYPHHVFFSAEARTYALCALGVAVTAFACEEWLDTASRRALAITCCAIVVTAYSHYYGVLLLPIPFVAAAVLRRPLVRDAAIAVALMLLAYVPGFVLAVRQGKAGTAWMEVPDTGARLVLVMGSFGRLGFDARHHYASGLARAVSTAAGIAILLYALWRTRLDRRARVFLLVVAVPILGAIAVAALGMTAYFPIRFESILSAAVVVWIVSSMSAAPRMLRSIVLAGAFVVGFLASIDIVRAPRPEQSPERVVARAVRAHVDPRMTVVASHLAYLEVFGLRHGNWQPRLIGYPHEYEVHPGSRPTTADAVRDLPRLQALPAPFIWIGEASSPEARVLRQTFRTGVVARAGDEVAAVVLGPARTAPH